MRYNSKALEIKDVISENGLLFKDIKISLGLLNSARKKHALCRENHKLHLNVNKHKYVIELVSVIEANIPSKS